MLVTPPFGASSNIALWRAYSKPPVELVVADLAKSSEKCNKKYLQSIMCQKERSCIMQNTLAYNVKTSIAGVLV